MTAPGGTGLVPNSPLLIEEKLDALGAASASATASTVAQRDANANLLINALLLNAPVTATAASTTTLTVASGQLQIFYGTAVQDVLLPTTGVVPGHQVTIMQTQTGVLSVKASGGTLVRTIPAGSWATFTAIQGTPTTNTQWFAQYPTVIPTAIDATINTQTGTTYTLAASDDGAVVTLNNASTVTVTVPQNSAAAIPIGAYIEFVQLGAGQVVFVAGTGATLNSRGTALKINGQYGTAGLRKIATNTFILAGDLTT